MLIRDWGNASDLEDAAGFSNGERTASVATSGRLDGSSFRLQLFTNMRGLMPAFKTRAWPWHEPYGQQIMRGKVKGHRADCLKPLLTGSAARSRWWETRCVRHDAVFPCLATRLCPRLQLDRPCPASSHSTLEPKVTLAREVVREVSMRLFQVGVRHSRLDVKAHECGAGTP